MIIPCLQMLEVNYTLFLFQTILHNIIIKDAFHKGFLVNIIRGGMKHEVKIKLLISTHLQDLAAKSYSLGTPALGSCLDGCSVCIKRGTKTKSVNYSFTEEEQYTIRTQKFALLCFSVLDALRRKSRSKNRDNFNYEGIKTLSPIMFLSTFDPFIIHPPCRLHTLELGISKKLVKKYEEKGYLKLLSGYHKKILYWSK